jgi:hypothetical protein
VKDPAPLAALRQLKSLNSVADVEEILGRLAHVQEGQPPLWGRLYAAAMLRHLREAFELALKDRPVKQHHRLLRGPQIRWLVLYSGVSWVRNYQTVPEVDVLLKQEVVEDFEAERGKLVRIINRFSHCREERLLDKHPFFGKFRREDWMRWGYLHTDHHLRQFDC